MTQTVAKERLISEPVGRRILSADQLDDVAEAVIMLAREVHVLTDRLLVLEEVLNNAGVDVGAVDTYQPSAETQAKIDARCEQMMVNIMRALRAAG